MDKQQERIQHYQDLNEWKFKKIWRWALGTVSKHVKSLVRKIETHGIDLLENEKKNDDDDDDERKKAKKKNKQFRNELDSTPGPSDTSRRSTGGLTNLWQRRLLAKLEY